MQKSQQNQVEPAKIDGLTPHKGHSTPAEIFEASKTGRLQIIAQTDEKNVVTAWGIHNPQGVLIGSIQIGKKAKTDDYRKAFAANGWIPELSELDDRVLINHSDGKRVFITDVQESVMIMTLKDLGLSSTDSIKRSIQVGASLNTFHPVKNYLGNLAPYKPTEPDYISELLKHLTFTDDHKDIAAVYVRKWFIGAIRRLLDDGHQNPALVLDGVQGRGKSYLVKWLSVKNEWFTDNAVSADNKDDLATLTTKFVWELAELDATTRKADVAALKAFLTKETVTYRPPYGHHAITKPALASFIGTVNAGRAGILKDQTGNRRFHVVELLEIDQKYSQSINPVNLWRQAFYLYGIGESADLTPDESQIRDEINEEYQSVSPVVDWVMESITITGDFNDRIMQGELRDRFMIAMGNKPMNRTDKGEINTYLATRGATTNAKYSGQRIIRGAKWTRN
jgi:hypothetical protein